MRPPLMGLVGAQRLPFSSPPEIFAMIARESPTFATCDSATTNQVTRGQRRSIGVGRVETKPGFAWLTDVRNVKFLKRRKPKTGRQGECAARVLQLC